MTGTPWGYVKVPQAGFNSLQPSEFAYVGLAFGDLDRARGIGPYSRK